MIRQTLVVASETFLLLRRGKIFLPALVAGIMIGFITNLASDWSVEDFRKILFDIGAFGYHITGAVVAIFWGTKIISDSRQEGAIEIRLAEPLHRGSWLVGNYLGLAAGLLSLAAVLLAVWQGLMLLNRFGWMDQNEIMVFAFLTLLWLIVGAVAIFFSSFTNSAVALFGSLCLWFVGLWTPSVAATANTDASPLATNLLNGMAWVWNLAQFNLSEQLVSKSLPPPEALLWLAVLGGSTILLLLALATAVFSRRDLVG